MLFSVRRQVASTKDEAAKDGVTVPTTVEQYTVSSKPATSDMGADGAGVELDFYDDDYMGDDDDEDEEDVYQDDDSDSGNGES